MNIKNLQIMYDYLVENRSTIEPNFDFEHYRTGTDWNSPVCNSVGCILGHGTGAFDKSELEINEYGNIEFTGFSEYILEIIPTINFELWDFLFSGHWSGINPSYEDALNRIKYVLDGGDYTKHADYLKAVEYINNKYGHTHEYK